LLEQIGLEFRIVVSDAEENIKETVPHRIVEELSCIKAQAVLDGLDTKEEVLVIGADTIVALGDEILGKPKDANDAFRMLRSISGTDHAVVTGIGLTVGGVTHTAYCSTLVRIDPIPDSEIWKYINSGDPFDKAGGYGIQGEFSKWVAGINGCYFNVVGLPANTLNRLFFEVTGEYVGK